MELSITEGQLWTCATWRMKGGGRGEGYPGVILMAVIVLTYSDGEARLLYLLYVSDSAQAGRP